MARTIKSIVAFNSGEMSPLLDSRIDLQKYADGCRTIENGIVQKYGGITRRPGFQYVGTCKYAAGQYTVRLQAFKISTENNFIIEFGHLYCRFIVNKSYVPAPAPAVPYEIVSPYSGDVSSGLAEVQELQFCQINDVAYITHPNHPPYKLTHVADTNWTLAPVIFNVPPLLDQNATGIMLSTSGLNGSVTIAASAAAWGTATHYAVLNAVIENGLIYVCEVDHTSGTFSTDLAAGYWLVQTVFTNTQINGYFQISQLRPVAELDLNITGNGTSSTLLCLGGWEMRTYGVWQATVTLYQSADYGTTWTVVTQAISNADLNVDTSGTSPGNYLFKLVVSNWSSPATAGTTTPRVSFVCTNALLNGLVQITAVSNAYAATGNVISALYSTSATTFWAEGAFSDYRGYPACVAAHQQRVIYGGSQFQPQRLWGSVIGDLENFDVGDGTTPDSSFAIDLAVRDNSPMRWIASMNDLIVGFSNAEWAVTTPDSTQALSATNIKAQEQSSFGSNFIQALVVGDALVFVDRFSLTVRQFLFSIMTNKYMSSDLTALANHITYPGVTRMDVQRQFEKYRVVWFIAAGQLLGLTYDQEQQVVAWHRHTGRPGGIDSFLSVASAYGIAASYEDATFVAVARKIGNATPVFIEQLGDIAWEHGTPSSPITPVITGASYTASGGGDANFQYHGFPPFVSAGQSQANAPIQRWLVATAIGQSRAAQYPGTPNYPNWMGYVLSTTGSSIQIDPVTGAQTGFFSALIETNGNLCLGDSFRNSYGGYSGIVQITTQITDISQYSTLLPFYTDVVNGGIYQLYLTKPWQGNGYLATYCGNGIWGDPNLSGAITLSVTMTAAQAAAAGTAVSVPFNASSSCTSFNASTGLMVGQASTINVQSTSPSQTGTILAIFTYLRTPIGGGASTTVTEEIPYAVGIGGKVSTTHDMPLVVGFKYVIQSVSLFDLFPNMENAELLVDGGYFGDPPASYQTSANWPIAPNFDFFGPSECWQDYENLSNGITMVSTGGVNWAQAGQYSNSDNTACFDDGETYAGGTLGYAYGGQGYANFGFFSVADYPLVNDDGESYANGTLTSTTGGNGWIAAGAFQVNDYKLVNDDGESYANGTLTSTTGGNGWIAAGILTVF